MAVASHLGIQLDEYDARIRTFIPEYETMLDAAARALCALDTTSPLIVDLGSGTGALAAACLRALPDARIIAVDEDADILELARQRLHPHGAQASTVLASFVDMTLPRSDAIAGSLTFHHVRTADHKRRLYRRCHEALVESGLFVTADCCPSHDPRLAAAELAAWRGHLLRTYPADETDGYLAAWAEEDVYFPLAAEIAMLTDASFQPDVVWRHGAFAVVAARKSC